MTRLLYLTQRIPFPPNKGEKIRQFHMLEYLRARFDVHLGTLIDDPADRAYEAEVRKLVPQSYFAQLNRRWARLACLRGLLTGEALSVTFYRTAGLQRWIDRVIREVRPDIVFVCSSNMAPYVLAHAGSHRLIVDLTDVDSEKWRAYADEGGGLMQWVHRREWHKTVALEAEVAQAADWCLFVSPEEAALFASMYPERAATIRAVSNGVDHGYFDPGLAYAAPFDIEKPNFVFTGTMDYPPNVDAVCWFAADILPLVRATMPTAQFHVVGANPAARVQALASLDGVFVTGRVADVRPYIAHAAAGVAPMRIARGIQNKVLEGMAMARPMVVTSDALEGIGAVPGAEVVLADGAEAFAAACVRAAGAEGAAIGAAARRRVVQDYTWAERMRALDPLLAASA